MGTQYVTEAQVEANLKGFDASATNAKVDSAALIDIIAEESQFIDVYIQARYTLPVTDDDGLVFLRKICIDLCVYRVAKVLMPREQKFLPDGGAIQDISQSGAYRRAVKLLEDLRDGVITLPSTPDEAKVFFSSYQDTNDTEKKFKLDTVQW